MVRTQVQLTEGQARAVKRLAAERDVSMAEVVRDAVDSYVDRQGADARRRRAIRAIGGFQSGHTDVSVRHDDHVVDAFAE